MRTRWKAALVAAVLLAGAAAAGPDPVVVPAAAVDHGEHADTGDTLASTTFDGPMVRRRAAIAIHPAPGADRDHLRAELRAAAKGTVGPLTEATFAVFSPEMLTYLVPEMTMVLPEGVPVGRAEAFMRDHRPADVAFYLVQPVLVHSLTFAVLPGGAAAPAAVREAVDREGILADALNHYDMTVQPAGITVRYFGAVLSDATIGDVRSALGRAARTDADRVVVAASEAGPGVDLSNGVPDLTERSHGH